jgi:hypothetical protein
MEDFYNVRRLALVLAIQAEIEGMKADNMLREQNNESPAYSYNAFSDKAEELRSMAYAHNEQL